MSPGYYHNPPKPASTRVRCPVCHEEVYSRAGIHPQCAVKRSDLPKPKGQAAQAAATAVRAGAAPDRAPAEVAPPGPEIASEPGHAAG